MATSGSYDYSLTAADIIQSALEDLQVFEAGQTVDSNDSAIALRTLNMLTKQWQGTADQAPGMKVFLRKIIYMFLQKSQTVYYIGPASGDDNATTTYYSTTLDANEASGQTILSVTSTANMTAADKIGIQLDTGAIHWTTISSFVTNDTVTIASQITSAASSGNYVFWYTSKPQRLTDILAGSLRYTDGSDLPMIRYASVEEYEQLNYKSSVGDPARYLVEPYISNTKITVDFSPGDVQKVVRFIGLYPAEDYDATTNDIAYPQEWLAALEWELAKRLAPKFGKAWTEAMERNWVASAGIARQLTPQNSAVYFQPGRDW